MKLGAFFGFHSHDSYRNVEYDIATAASKASQERQVTERYLEEFNAQNDFNIAVVYLVTSPLAIFKQLVWLERYPIIGSILRFMRSTNATHWGFRIRGRYYDLKRVGRWPNARTRFVPSAHAPERESKGVKVVPIGVTHFRDDDIAAIGLHAITHVPYYTTWIDNCQFFAINIFAPRIMCNWCTHDQKSKRYSEFSSYDIYQSITTFHRLELILMLFHLWGLTFYFSDFSIWTGKHKISELALVLAIFVSFRIMNLMVFERHFLRTFDANKESITEYRATAAVSHAYRSEHTSPSLRDYEEEQTRRDRDLQFTFALILYLFRVLVSVYAQLELSVVATAIPVMLFEPVLRLYRRLRYKWEVSSGVTALARFHGISVQELYTVFLDESTHRGCEGCYRYRQAKIAYALTCSQREIDHGQKEWSTDLPTSASRPASSARDVDIVHLCVRTATAGFVLLVNLWFHTGLSQLVVSESFFQCFLCSSTPVSKRSHVIRSVVDGSIAVAFLCLWTRLYRTSNAEWSDWY